MLFVMQQEIVNGRIAIRPYDSVICSPSSVIRVFPMPKRPLSRCLFALFMLAMLMGPGPGLRLVNPDPADPNATFTVFGMPIIYVWGLFWYAVQLAAIIIAYKKIWSQEGPNESH